MKKHSTPEQTTRDFKVSKNERDKFSQISQININSWLITCDKLLKSTQGKNYAKNNQSISTNLINITQ